MYNTADLARAEQIIEARHLEARTEEAWDALAAAANHARHGDPEDQIASDQALNNAYLAAAESVAAEVAALGFEVKEGREAGAVINIEGDDVTPFTGDASEPVAASFREVMKQYKTALDF